MFKSIKINRKIINIVLTLFLILLLVYACKSSSNIMEEQSYIDELKQSYPDLSDYIDKVLEMNDKERKGLLLMVGIKDKVLSEETIKTLGTVTVSVKLYEGVIGNLKVDVISA